MNIFLLGATGQTGSIFMKMAKETVITKMTEIIIKSMKDNHISRIVTISTAGIHDEFSFVMNFIVKSFLKHAIHDHRLAAEAIISSGLEYTIARPLALTKGPLTEVYRKTPKGVPRGGKEISSQDLAHFLLSVIENDEFKNETVGLAY